MGLKNVRSGEVEPGTVELKYYIEPLGQVT